MVLPCNDCAGVRLRVCGGFRAPGRGIVGRQHRMHTERVCTCFVLTGGGGGYPFASIWLQGAVGACEFARFFERRRERLWCNTFLVYIWRVVVFFEYLCLYLYECVRHSCSFLQWLVVSWIDSKAMFGDELTYVQEHQSQLLSYVNRYLLQLVAWNNIMQYS